MVNRLQHISAKETVEEMMWLNVYSTSQQKEVLVAMLEGKSLAGNTNHTTSLKNQVP